MREALFSQACVTLRHSRHVTFTSTVTAVTYDVLVISTSTGNPISRVYPGAGMVQGSQVYKFRL